MIALIIIGVVMLFVGFIWALRIDWEDSVWVIPYIIIIIGIAVLFLGTMYYGEKEAYINTLDGKQKYEKQYIYRVNDTIPVDTLYVKITSK